MCAAEEEKRCFFYISFRVETDANRFYNRAHVETQIRLCPDFIRTAGPLKSKRENTTTRCGYVMSYESIGLATSSICVHFFI